MSKHNKTADRKPAIPKLVVTLQPEGWEALRLAREVSGIPARTIARRAIAAYIQQPIFRPPPGCDEGDNRRTARPEPAGQLRSRGIDRPRVPKDRRPNT
jgi:hypothetical protein